MMSLELQESFERTRKALAAFKVMLDKPMDKDQGNIDASIQRFEFSIELFWKLLKQVLASRGQKPLYLTAKDLLQEAYAGKLIDHDTIWLAMLKDRNATSHAYNEKLADEIYHRLSAYYDEMKISFDALYAKFGKASS